METSASGRPSSITMSWKYMIFILICFVAYLAVGAVIFSALESSEEEDIRTHLRNHKAIFMANFSCITEEAVEALVLEVVKAFRSGVTPYQNVSGKTNWDFSSSLFFSGTVLTTIGYGNLAPSTEGGRHFCVLYALIGIPFLGWILSIVSAFYRDAFYKLIDRMDSILEKYFRVRSRRYKRMIVWFVVAVFTYAILVLVPALIFTYMEKWDFKIAHYYCFITLTTIGFGDYVATVNTDEKHVALEILYDLIVTVWYIFGLSFLAVVISAIATRQRKTVAKLGEKLGNSRTNQSKDRSLNEEVKDTSVLELKDIIPVDGLNNSISEQRLEEDETVQ